jgi:hypothetical protein
MLEGRVIDEADEYGRYRPMWQASSGSPTITNNELVLPAGDTTAQEVDAASDHTVGYWEFDYQFASPPADNFNFAWWKFVDDGNNFLRLLIRDEGFVELKGQQNGSSVFSQTTDNTAFVDGNGHTVRIERDSGGNFEVFLDGSSQITASNTYVPSPTRTALRNEIGVDWTISEIRSGYL